MVTSRINNVIICCLSLVFFVFMIYETREEIQRRDFILQNYQLTMGRIINYLDKANSDLGGGRSIEYTYSVNDVEYTRRVSTGMMFDECKALSSDCLKKRFCVVYSFSDPSNSLIDFYHEVFEDSVRRPADMSYFE